VWIAALSFVVCACALKVSEDNITSKNTLLTASLDMRRPLDKYFRSEIPKRSVAGKRRARFNERDSK
jgi:hypothetical protein